jgi:hypothetical protein
VGEDLLRALRLPLGILGKVGDRVSDVFQQLAGEIPAESIADDHPEHCDVLRALGRSGNSYLGTGSVLTCRARRGASWASLEVSSDNLTTLCKADSRVVRILPEMKRLIG